MKEEGLNIMWTSCVMQFCRDYDPYSGTKQKNSITDESDADDMVEDDCEEEEELADNIDDNPQQLHGDLSINETINTADEDIVYPLPKMIKLLNVIPGEPPYMRRKGNPNAIRMHKVKDKASHEWLYSQILLYRPFQNEEVELLEIRENADR